MLTREAQGCDPPCEELCTSPAFVVAAEGFDEPEGLSESRDCFPLGTRCTLPGGMVPREGTDVAT